MFLFIFLSFSIFLSLFFEHTHTHRHTHTHYKVYNITKNTFRNTQLSRSAFTSPPQLLLLFYFFSFKHRCMSQMRRSRATTRKAVLGKYEVRYIEIRRPVTRCPRNPLLIILILACFYATAFDMFFLQKPMHLQSLKRSNVVFVTRRVLAWL